MTVLAQKQVQLAVANTSYTLVWNNTDFSRHLGYPIIDYPCSLSITIQNNANQAIYVSLSYQTLNQQVDVIQRSSLVGIGAGKQALLSPQSTTGLGSLQSDISLITLTFVSQGTGFVTAFLDVALATTVIADSPYIGTDIRAAADYTSILRNAAFTLAPNTIDYTPPGFSYVIPATKRGFLTHFFIRIPITPQANDQIGFVLRFNGLANSSLWSFKSIKDAPFTFSVSGPNLFYLEAGDFLEPHFSYNMALGGISSKSVFMAMQIVSMY